MSAQTPPSRQQPQKTINFKLKLGSCFLRKSIDCLGDHTFNPEGAAVVEISNYGFAITVRNDDSNVIAAINFKAAWLIDFECTNPLLPHIFNLEDFAAIILSPILEENDYITISYVHDELQLYFTYKSETKVLNITKLEDYPSLHPHLAKLCKAPFTRTVLDEVISYLMSYYQPVSVEVKKGAVTISVGVDGKYEFEDWIIEAEDAEPAESGKRHTARFYLPHLQAMSKAVLLDQDLDMFFLTEPANHLLFVFRYDDEESCVVYFLLKAELIETTQDDSGGDASGVPRFRDDNSEATLSGGHATAAPGASPSDGYGFMFSATNPHKRLRGDASEAAQSGGDASGVPQFGDDDSEATLSRGDATAATQSGGDAA